MTADVGVDALGVRIDITTASLTDEQRAAVRNAWADAAATTTGDADVHVVPDSGGSAAGDASELLERLSQDVTFAAIGARRGQAWMLHAAGLALPDGRVVVLVGPSGRGKSTASRTLGAHFGYVSDETVAIAPDGTVHPYRKPLSLIEAAGAPKAQRSARELGLGDLPDAPLRAAKIVLLDRRPDVDGVQILPETLTGALAELVAQTSYLGDLPTPLQTVASIIAGTGGIVRVVYREASDLVAVLPGLADGSDDDARAGAAGDETWLGTDVRAVAADLDPDEPRYFRASTVDAIRVGDELALVHGRSGEAVVRVIGGISPALWAAASAATPDELVTAAIAAHGRPDDAEPTTLVADALAELVAAGVLERRLPRWRIADRVAWTGDDRVTAVDLDDPDMQARTLEGTAAAIWAGLQHPIDLDGLVDLVAPVADEISDTDLRPAVRADVAGFVRAVRDAGLVHAE